MKLAVFAASGEPARVGLVASGRSLVLDVMTASRSLSGDERSSIFSTMLGIIDAGEAALDQLHELEHKAAGREELWRPLADVALLSPIPAPRQLRDFAGFSQHLIDGPYGLLRLRARELGEPMPVKPTGLAQPLADDPLFYFGNRLNVIGHDATISWPAEAVYLDFELEIGCCIGRTGKNIRREEADDYIFGYTIFNDVSARDVQGRQMPGGLGPCKAKSFDGGNVLGPWIVTRDEMNTPYGGTARVRVNGETWAEKPITGTVHEFPDMIEFAIKDETIFAGEVFGSGTVSGCCGLEMDRWIQRGDVVELEVDAIGVLRNRYE